ncbi:hypothetical protein EYZ11_002448 [Aspergillus tanneri]|uniref:Uncharacterized protein n=1 Tax=Aspergillus tanneri TaxID=1220188 RepID=A0A4S3JQY3_9EURO|nr:hypothetical protein EYZ11_002448 [Aspergillus tanneri]
MYDNLTPALSMAVSLEVERTLDQSRVPGCAVKS